LNNMFKKNLILVTILSFVLFNSFQLVSAYTLEDLVNYLQNLFFPESSPSVSGQTGGLPNCDVNCGRGPCQCGTTQCYSDSYCCSRPGRVDTCYLTSSYCSQICGGSVASTTTYQTTTTYSPTTTTTIYSSTTTSPFPTCGDSCSYVSQSCYCGSTLCAVSAYCCLGHCYSTLTDCRRVCAGSTTTTTLPGTTTTTGPSGSTTTTISGQTCAQKCATYGCSLGMCVSTCGISCQYCFGAGSSSNCPALSCCCLSCPAVTTTTTSSTTTTTIYSSTTTTTTSSSTTTTCKPACYSCFNGYECCSGQCNLQNKCAPCTGTTTTTSQSSSFSCSRISSNSWRCNSPTNNVVCNSISSTQWRCGIA